jgi:hypothetical protein
MDAAFALSSTCATRINVNVGSVFLSPILVRTGCGKSNEEASMGAMMMGVKVLISSSSVD